jgi:protein-disulfide isomerase
LTRGFLIAALAALVIAPQAAAVEIKYPQLENFARRALTLCPGESRIVIEPVDQAGPANFQAYRVALTSSVHEECREVAFALVSEKTSNVLLAGVFVLPDDGRTPAERIKERAEIAMKKPFEVSISATPNADGLRMVSLTNRTSDGPVVTTGYLDASERFFMVGRLMDMKKDPRTQYLSMLGASSGARRGSSVSRVQVLEISDFQCPSCQWAHDQFEPFLKKHGDKIGYTRLDLPFFENHDWTLRAALAARAIQKHRPDLYWDYVDFIFKQQTNLRAATIDKVIDGFLEDRDADVAKIRQFTNNSQEKRALIDQVGRLYSSEIYATPTLLVNGQKIYWNRDSKFVFEYIESLLKPAPSAGK